MADWFNGLYDGVQDIGSSFRNWMDGRDVPQGAGYGPEDLSLARQALLGKLSSNVIAASMAGLAPAQRASLIAGTGDAVGAYSQVLSSGTERARAGLAVEREREDVRLANEQRVRLEDLVRQRAAGAAPGAVPGAPASIASAVPGAAAGGAPVQAGVGAGVQGEALPPIPGTTIADDPVAPRSVGAMPGTPANPAPVDRANGPRWRYEELAAPQKAVADQVESSTAMPRQIFTGVWGMESSHRMSSPRGDGGRAAGIGQMHQGALTDMNRTYGTNYSQEDLEREPNLAATMAARYWVAQKQRFGSDHLATLAYNWGPGAVQTWLQSGGGWDRVPEIRRNYVANVHGAANVPGLGGNLPAPQQQAAAPAPQQEGGASAPAAQAAVAREASGNGRVEGWWDALQITPQAALTIMQQPREIRERVISGLYAQHYEQNKPTVFGSAEEGRYAYDPRTREVTQLRPGTESGLTVPKAVAAQEDTLRTQYIKAAGGFEEAQRAFLAMPNLARDNTGASDTALVFSLFKTIDPASTVREGEFATIQNAASVPERIRNTYNALVNGTKLTPEMRDKIVQTGREYYDRQSSSYGQARANSADLSRRYGVSPERVLGLDARDPALRQEAEARQAAAAATPERVAEMTKPEIKELLRGAANFTPAQKAAVAARIAALGVE